MEGSRKNWGKNMGNASSNASSMEVGLADLKWKINGTNESMEVGLAELKKKTWKSIALFHYCHIKGPLYQMFNCHKFNCSRGKPQ